MTCDHALIGTWALLSWENVGADGQVSHPMGVDAVGYLIYSFDGRFSMTISRTDGSWPSAVTCRLTPPAWKGTITSVMTEAPGGTVGCDVCGILLDVTRASIHDAWHRREEDRLNRLLEMVQELVRVLPGSRA